VTAELVRHEEVAVLAEHKDCEVAQEWTAPTGDLTCIWLDNDKRPAEFMKTIKKIILWLQKTLEQRSGILLLNQQKRDVIVGRMVVKTLEQN
jgi:hypothetical protein